MLKPAAALGLVCFAPNQGQQVRFTRPDTWLGGLTDHDPEQAMDQVTRRFLAASCPVTREDFARWWGIPSPARGRRLLEPDDLEGWRDAMRRAILDRDHLAAYRRTAVVHASRFNWDAAARQTFRVYQGVLGISPTANAASPRAAA